MSYRKCECSEGQKSECLDCGRPYYLSKIKPKTFGNQVPFYMKRQEVEDLISTLGSTIKLETDRADPGRYGYLTALRAIDKRLWAFVRAMSKAEASDG